MRRYAHLAVIVLLSFSMFGLFLYINNKARIQAADLQCVNNLKKLNQNIFAYELQHGFLPNNKHLLSFEINEVTCPVSNLLKCKDPYDGNIQYGMNEFLCDGIKKSDKSSQTILLGDSARFYTDNNVPEVVGTSVLYMPVNEYSARTTHFRHSDLIAMISFLDGHVKRVKSSNDEVLGFASYNLDMWTGEK